MNRVKLVVGVRDSQVGEITWKIVHRFATILNSYIAGN